MCVACWVVHYRLPNRFDSPRSTSRLAMLVSLAAVDVTVESSFDSFQEEIKRIQRQSTKDNKSNANGTELFYCLTYSVMLFELM